MKVRASIKKICGKCQIIRRGRKKFVICSSEDGKRHKQRQG